ncbi:hypothetical protein Vretifemale_6927 [Volvox reticuliferus]|uniref:Uncharacterized protein n=2 Tax=Volvox reticuliferus TaxID=1737510 RepID=A0A8J4FIA6_9CHLO|nr:hypothetical protein Vretifemale_6927 [Volvox reticuliferus]
MLVASDAVGDGGGDGDACASATRGLLAAAIMAPLFCSANEPPRDRSPSGLTRAEPPPLLPPLPSGTPSPRSGCVNTEQLTLSWQEAFSVGALSSVSLETAAAVAATAAMAALPVAAVNDAVATASTEADADASRCVGAMYFRSSSVIGAADALAGSEEAMAPASLARHQHHRDHHCSAGTSGYNDLQYPWMAPAQLLMHTVAAECDSDGGSVAAPGEVTAAVNALAVTRERCGGCSDCADASYPQRPEAAIDI